MQEDFSKDPYKKQTYETYALWKSLPSFLKGQPKVALEKFGIEEDSLFDFCRGEYRYCGNNVYRCLRVDEGFFACCDRPATCPGSV
jgi:hypothetical protein